MNPRYFRFKSYMAIVGIAVFILMSCKAKSRFQKGTELQNQYEYQSAISAYEEVTKNHSKSKWADSAKVAIQECEAVLDQIDEAFEEASNLVEAERYDEATAELESILSLGVNEEISTEVQEKIEEVEKIKRSSYDYIVNVVIGRMRKGVSPRSAAEEFEGVEIEWTATLGTIGHGISSSLPPINFKKGKWMFWGYPSSGLNQLEYYLFCERNVDKPVTVEGTILGGNDWPHTPLAVKVTGIKLGGKEKPDEPRQTENEAGEIFRGTIDDNLTITMELNRKGDKLSGSYYYEKHKVDIPIKGTVDENGNFRIDEYGNNGGVSGTFKGRFLSDTQMKGTWVSPDGKRNLSFSLTKE